ncbi:23S rRNA (cytosine(1962)-C(5))-methyltransferase RlmI, partial [candidate division KSB1 bacterium]|nr:23S rRNA (cytosine(1962)-C(5))-methyltransferase RlmI [candidate division KSB1 bacterium]
MNSILLKAKREKSLLRHHPWVFSGAIAKINGDPQFGETVDIIAHDGRFLGRGAYSPQSQITVRIWTFDENEPVTMDFFRSRLERAIRLRESLITRDRVNAYRLVNAESDSLPGVIVDRYADYLVCQFLTAGAELWKQTIISQLQELIICKGIYERSDVSVREKENLDQKTGVIAGELPPDLIEIKESDISYFVDVKHGQKTGFYLDQRENRSAIGNYARDREILNCFSYTDGFAIPALISGAASVTNIESSAGAVELAIKNAELNEIDADRNEHTEADVFTQLRRYRDSRREFDLIILDP